MLHGKSDGAHPAVSKERLVEVRAGACAFGALHGSTCIADRRLDIYCIHYQKTPLRQQCAEQCSLCPALAQSGVDAEGLRR